MRNKKISILLLSVLFVSNFSIMAKANELPNLEIPKIELPEVKLPELDIETPQNFPDINVDLSIEYESIMNDLVDRGLGSKNLNLADKEMDFDWSKQGNEEKLSSEEFNSYLSKAKEKYLPKIEEMKEKTDLKYEKIDLSSKWDLMSFNDAKKSVSSLPNYQTAKKELQAGKKTLSVPTFEKATLSYSPSSEFTKLKEEILANSSKINTSLPTNSPQNTSIPNNSSTPGSAIPNNVTPNSGGHNPADYSNLPSGISFSNGRFVDNRESISIGGTLLNAVSDVITVIPDFFDAIKGTEQKVPDSHLDMILEKNIMEEDANPRWN